MKTNVKIALIASTAIFLTGCASFDRTFNATAGSDIDEGGFGNPTMQIMMAQTGNGGGMIVNLNNRFAGDVDSMVNFGFNSAQLDAQARATLSHQANWIRQFPEVRFRVYGHTDLVGNQTYNKRLGLRRAQAVVAYLTSQGISRSRLEAVASFGETQPLIVTENRERRNRRTVTEVIGFVGANGDDCCLNGKYARIIRRGYVASAGENTTTAPAAGG